MTETERELLQSKIALAQHTASQALISEIHKYGLLAGGDINIRLLDALVVIYSKCIGDIATIYREAVQDHFDLNPSIIDGLPITDLSSLGNTIIDEESGRIKAEFARSVRTLFPTASPESFTHHFSLIDHNVRIHKNRTRIYVEQLSKSRQSEKAERGGVNFRWWSERALQLFHIGLLLLTAYYTRETFAVSRREYRLRNRPVIEQSLSRFPSFISDIQPERKFTISTVLSNRGDSIALDVQHITVLVENGTVIYPEDSSKITYMPDGQIAVDEPDDDPTVVAPKSEAMVVTKFSPKLFYRVAYAKDRKRSGIFLVTRYRARWSSDESETYGVQLRILPTIIKNGQIDLTIHDQKFK